MGDGKRYFYCPHCDKMVERTKGNEHLQKDAEAYGDRGPSFAEALMLVGRMIAHNQRQTP